ncbi:glycoside hydrolase family 57 protein [uncultured Acetobacteroides sp.]|uniref:glycoside hydrolase family 57 protein n=1 Tax=uncultured Acetobacteroides sp. TaxID=1760811 RepID=UPI0029F4616D|nr:glycoside hydrolase family 57 protein [uncultured Acetobacteroides sp.]
MKDVCCYFQVHQPFRLKRFRFFDIGKGVGYFDDSANRSILNKVAEKCYLPANRVLLKEIKRHKGAFRVAFSISGTALEQLEQYAPSVLDSFRELVRTGCVELLAETYYHTLSSVVGTTDFEDQVGQHRQRIEALFGVSPTVFRNTELVYSDLIGARVAKMGFRAILTEGYEQVLGGRSPHALYLNPTDRSLKILLRSYKLSDDIAFRFSDRGWDGWPLTVEKYVKWLKEAAKADQVVNLFMDYETFGEHQWASTGIFSFLEQLPGAILKTKSLRFATPSEVAERGIPAGELSVPSVLSWADAERDLSAWLGNGMQDDAFEKLYSLSEKVNQLSDEAIRSQWGRLQSSDHFYYMCVKQHSDGEVHSYFNHYNSPFEAYITYMNVLSDFEMRVDRALEEQRQSRKAVAPEATSPAAQASSPTFYLG